MSKLIAIVLMIFTAILHILFGSPRVYGGESSTSMRIESSGDLGDCGSLSVTFDRHVATRMEESFSIPGRGTELRAVLPAASGARVTGWDRSDYEITVCKAARDAETLDRVAVAHDGGAVSVTGPQGGDWVVYLLIHAPKDSSIDFETSNGPLDFHGVTGKLRARTENGPVTFRGCAADVVATTENGPISFTGSGRNVSLKALNGPVSVDLEGRSWEGGRLEASTQNGPVSLELEAGFQSGVDVTSTGHSPFSCSAAACAGADRTRDDDHRAVHFGDRATAVSLSTENGPVSIRSPKNEI
ncbi:MAG: hypothetical protein HY049_03835 [Acidobacteria bacterium]|nr:hypothetical protein [Acidobacteriota bacterium]